MQEQVNYSRLDEKGFEAVGMTDDEIAMSFQAISKRLKWVLFALICLEIILFTSGVLPFHMTALLVAVAEGTAALFALIVIVPRVIAIHRKMREGGLLAEAMRAEFKEIIPFPLLKMAAAEVGLFAAVGRFFQRKIDVPDNAYAITYGSSFRIMSVVLLAFTPLELLLIDLMVQHFAPGNNVLRLMLFVFALYASLWVLGLLLATKVYPHYLSDAALVLRYAHIHKVEIPLIGITKIERISRDCEGFKLLYYDNNTMYLNNNMRTCEVLLTIDNPCSIVVDNTKNLQELSHIAFSVDDVSGTIRTISARLNYKKNDE